MRRSGHPSRPRAITCCFFASLKTLLISTKATCLTPKSTSRASFSLAGFQVTLIGRFWVTPEGPRFLGPPQGFSCHCFPSLVERREPCRYTMGSAGVARLAPCPIYLPSSPARYALGGGERCG